jgi:hypothetical protein
VRDGRWLFLFRRSRGLFGVVNGTEGRFSGDERLVYGVSYDSVRRLWGCEGEVYQKKKYDGRMRKTQTHAVVSDKVQRRGKRNIGGGSGRPRLRVSACEYTYQLMERETLVLVSVVFRTLALLENLVSLEVL